MKSAILILITAVISAATTAGAAGAPSLPQAKTNEILLKVGGIVCQFCAFGVAKNLQGLEFMDRTKLKNGVFVDIEKQHVALALVPGKAPDFAGIHKSIDKGGYQFISAHLTLHGKLEQRGGGWFLRDESHPAEYALGGKADASWVPGARVRAQVEVMAAAIATLKTGQIIPATAYKLEEVK